MYQSRDAQKPTQAEAQAGPSDLKVVVESRGGRTKRTSHHERAKRNEADLTRAWSAKSTEFAQLELGSSSTGTSVGQADKVIYVAAGEPLGFSFDETTKTLEFDTKIDHAYPPRTAMIARATRELVSATTGIGLNHVTLKAMLQLNQDSRKATPVWCIRFRAVGQEPMALAAIEPNLRDFLSLATSTTEKLWTLPDRELVPNSVAPAAVVKAAKDLRKAAAGKAIAADCRIRSDLFSEEIKVAPTVGGAPPDSEESKPVEGVGEVVGYNRATREVDIQFNGHQASTEISMDAEVFQSVVKDLAGVDGNVCQFSYQVEKEAGRVVRTTLQSLACRQLDLFIQLPESARDGVDVALVDSLVEPADADKLG